MGHHFSQNVLNRWNIYWIYLSTVISGCRNRMFVIFFFLIPLATDFPSLDNFQNFINFGFYVTLWLKISVTKFWKSKIWDDSFKAFSVSFVLMYFIFSVDAVFMEKFATQNRLFLDFSKNQKNVDFVRQITTPRMHPKNFW